MAYITPVFCGSLQLNTSLFPTREGSFYSIFCGEFLTAKLNLPSFNIVYLDGEWKPWCYYLGQGVFENKISPLFKDNFFIDLTQIKEWLKKENYRLSVKDEPNKYTDRGPCSS
jgi:hypothetical protein